MTRIREQGSDVVVTADPDDLAVILDTQAMTLLRLSNIGPAAATDLELKVTARGGKFLSPTSAPARAPAPPRAASAPSPAASARSTPATRSACR